MQIKNFFQNIKDELEYRKHTLNKSVGEIASYCLERKKIPLDPNILSFIFGVLCTKLNPIKNPKFLQFSHKEYLSVQEENENIIYTLRQMVTWGLKPSLAPKKDKMLQMFYSPQVQMHFQSQRKLADLLDFWLVQVREQFTPEDFLKYIKKIEAQGHNFLNKKNVLANSVLEKHKLSIFDKNRPVVMGFSKKVVL